MRILAVVAVIISILFTISLVVVNKYAKDYSMPLSASRPVPDDPRGPGTNPGSSGGSRAPDSRIQDPQIYPACMIQSSDVCLFGAATNASFDAVLCAGPLHNMHCNNSIRSVLYTNCNGRLGNVMMAYSTMFYFYKLGFNAILDEYQAKIMHDVFQPLHFNLKEGVHKYESMSVKGETFYGTDEFGDTVFDQFIDNLDNYRHNKFLYVGMYPTPFSLFKQVWSQLKNEFKFREDIMTSAKSALELSTEDMRLRFPGKELVYVAVHARRGDYVDSPMRVELFANDALAFVRYFEYCMQTMREKLDTEQQKSIFLMLSEDQDWLRKYFGNKSDIAFPGPLAPLPGDQMPGRDMAIFSLCKHLIRSLGTYSLWGSFWVEGTVMNGVSTRDIQETHMVSKLNSSNYIQVDLQQFLNSTVTNPNP